MKSPLGIAFVRSLTRGAVRERMLYNRLADNEIQVPTWEIQLEYSKKLASVIEIETKLKQQLEVVSTLPDAFIRESL